MFKPGQFKMAPDGLDAPLGGGTANVPADPGSPASDEGSQDVNWGAMADDSLPETPDKEEGEAGSSPSTPGTAPQPPAAQPPAQDEPLPAEPPAAAPPQQPPAAAPSASQEEVQREAAAARAKARDELAQIYTGEMSDEDKQALIANPETVMPRMLAQAAMDGASIALAEFRRLMPELVVETTTRQTQAVKVWSEFDSANPDLAKQEYRKTILAAIQSVKAANPNLPKDKAMRAVARTARALLNLEEPTGTPPANPPKNQTTPAAPVAPFVPVGRGGARPAAPTKKSDNPWDEFIDD